MAHEDRINMPFVIEHYFCCFYIITSLFQPILRTFAHESFFFEVAIKFFTVKYFEMQTDILVQLNQNWFPIRMVNHQLKDVIIKNYNHLSFPTINYYIYN